MRFVTFAFRDYVLIWGMSMMDDIRRGIIEPYESWYDLKRLMRKRFFYLHMRGSKSVEKYHKEMEIDLLRVQLRESEEATIPRFLHGLNMEIQDVWLSEHGELVVNRQVEVSFTLGRYEDKVLCDAVPVEATYQLLGRPW
ncbi:hypothetical protein CR513_06441, partial [Mucuna pruriens]